MEKYDFMSNCIKCGWPEKTVEYQGKGMFNHIDKNIDVLRITCKLCKFRYLARTLDDDNE